MNSVARIVHQTAKIRLLGSASVSVNVARNTSNGSAASEENLDRNAVRTKILDAALPYVNQFGWSREAVSLGAEHCKLPGTMHGLFDEPRSELVFHAIKKWNRTLREDMTKNPKQSEKTKEYLMKYLKKRLEMLAPYIEKWPEAMAILARPKHVPTATNLLLKMCDDIWYYAGDRSYDFSWYTKRVPLMGVYGSSLLFMLRDKSQDNDQTWHFLKRRLDDVNAAGNCTRRIQDGVSLANSVLYSACFTARNIVGANTYQR